MKLTNRLNAVVDLVSHRKVADIGCDHGKVSINLILNNSCDYVIASDVNKGPADACKKNVAKYGLGDKIEVRCGNGISVLEEGECDSIIIAGMGGELISRIIRDNINVAKSAKEIIMQPMTSEENLRDFLYFNGFVVTNEVLAKEDDKIYVIIKAQSGVPKKHSIYFPPLLKWNNNELIECYFKKVCKRVNDKIKGAKISGEQENLIKYQKILDEVNEIYESISDM